MEHWYKQLNEFIKYIQLENDEQYIDNCLQSAFTTIPYSNGSDYFSSEGISWILCFDYFKSLYTRFENNLRNMYICFLYYHCGSLEKAERILRIILVGKGYKFKSVMTSREILIDKQLLQKIEKFFNIINENNRYSEANL